MVHQDELGAPVPTVSRRTGTSRMLFPRWSHHASACLSSPPEPPSQQVRS